MTLIESKIDQVFYVIKPVTLDGCQKMGIYGKVILIFAALASLFLFTPMDVCAQPLGILSQKPEQESQQKILSS